MVVKEMERGRLSKVRINGKVVERESDGWMEVKRGCKGWEGQIDKGKGTEKSILRQEYALWRINLLGNYWLLLLTGRGISVITKKKGWSCFHKPKFGK